MMGSLRTSFGEGGALEEAGALGGTDVLKAAEREPLDTRIKAREGVEL